jgi:PAS domain S-box-containing protein
MHSQLFDSVPDALIVVDGRGRIRRANSQAEQLFGYARGALLGLDVEALMPQHMRGQHRDHRDGYMANPRIRSMGDTGQALTGQRMDGRQFPVEIALSPIEDEHETRYLASIRDVSESHRARQALIRARYDTLVARIGQLALEAADDACVVERVPALLAEALGVEVVALALLDLDMESVEVRASSGLEADWMETARLLRESGTATWQDLASSAPRVVDDASAPGTTTLPFPLVDGARSGVVVPLLDRERPMGGLVALSRHPRRFDHDALHLLQSVANMLAALMQRRRTEEQLVHAQRLDALGQLTGGIAHDFNNLLTVLSGSLQLLDEEFPHPAGAAELIASALRSVDRGAELTAKLLAFARRPRLHPGPIDARRLLRDLELMLGRTLGDLIDVDVICADDIPPAYADTAQLETAQLNLALNARDAMPRGGEITLTAGERWITASETQQALGTGHYVVFSVIDTGLGMSKGTLARAVDPFFTTKETGRGSGLGLSMVYGFARQSGGSLQIESALGYGTRVHLYLPVARDGMAVRAPARAPAASGHGATVLVVENESEVRSIAAAFLESMDYRVVACSDAAEAMARLRQDHTISLLFSDVMLSHGMDGNQLAQAALDLRPDLAVLLTSGCEDPMADPEAVGPSLFELLRKPYRREQLAAAVQRSLDQCGIGSAPSAPP